MRRQKIQLIKLIFISFLIYLIYIYTKPLGLNENFYRNDKFPNLHVVTIDNFQDNNKVFF